MEAFACAGALDERRQLAGQLQQQRLQVLLRIDRRRRLAVHDHGGEAGFQEDTGVLRRCLQLLGR
ncbi:MAG: hypothetical protein WDM85_14065 [Caulobacteraceae bacterium]